jgi:hypothetical protein
MPPKQELANREGHCASPASHRNEFPAEYSLAGCSPAEPASAFSAALILLPWAPFVYQLSANGKLHNPSVSHKRAHSMIFLVCALCTFPKSCTILHNVKVRSHTITTISQLHLVCFQELEKFMADFAWTGRVFCGHRESRSLARRLLARTGRGDAWSSTRRNTGRFLWGGELDGVDGNV